MPDKLKLLCDENVDRHIVVSLRARHFDVKYISEEHQGIEDTDVLEIATQTGRVLLTEDKDFGELVFRTGQPARGIMLIRLSDLPPKDAADLVCEVVETHGKNLVDHFAVLTSKALRIRGLEP